MVVARLLMMRHPTLFWTPSDAHCIDLMLEDMGKITFIRDIVDSSRSITKFIYNHTSVLSLMMLKNNNLEGPHSYFWCGCDEEDLDFVICIFMY